MSLLDVFKRTSTRATLVARGPSGGALRDRAASAPASFATTGHGTGQKQGQSARVGVIQDQVDLPLYRELAPIPANAKDFAALLVSLDGRTVYLAVLPEMATRAITHTIKQSLSHSGSYDNVKMIEVTTNVLHALHAARSIGRLDTQEVAGEAKGLNIRMGFELIATGIEMEASDIHIDIRNTGRDAPMVLVRLRIHGALEEHACLRTAEAVQVYTEMVRGLYQNDTISNALVRTSGTFNELDRQEAMLKPPIKNAELRFESLPEKGGFDVVMRINGHDGKSAARKSLDQLGLSDDHTRDLTRASQAPHGLVVVVGSTGSGKTTTITTILAMDPSAKYKKRISLEIPPESDIPYLSQVPVKESDLNNKMDGVMRSDPDVISAGEIRNRETALMAQDSSITGHLTFATFHANGILFSLQRMLSERIGFDPHILTADGFLRAVLYQTLVEILCPTCKQPALNALAPDKVELLKTKFALPLEGAYVRYRVGGGETPCPRCRGTGVVGRTVVAEVLVPNRYILDLIAKNQFREAMDMYRDLRTAKFHEPGTLGKTYVEHALYKVSQGDICADSIFNLENLWTYLVRPPADRRKPAIAGVTA
ncbi:type II secretion system protein E (plasmid) [Rhodoferax ferrireducens T118]|uniref:Type II secretion system protein E n=1 Tax=Albidiferax ferrireducens (strain ATCC BAA-621 / DSM 15236 / T118) TaxID=338969 RepID=Q21QL2_ALBFT|nr:ATPase, T2SS/T4P/T4SS family [Rhodoferax ferrireducens]ABD71933.1 type II secretion system protein E [Rhodoferax ferrireducens T118]